MGGQWCCVPECTNYGGHAPQGTSWHTLPKKPELRKKWLINIRRDWSNKSQSKRSTVCSHHFVKDDFRTSRFLKRKFLKENAVPSIFNWTKRERERDMGQAKRASVPRKRLRNEVQDVPNLKNHDAAEALLELGCQSREATVPLPDAHKLLRLLAESSAECQQLQEKISALNKTNAVLMEKNVDQEKLLKRLTLQVLNYDSIRHDNSAVQFYTGLPTAGTFDSLFDYLQDKSEHLCYWDAAEIKLDESMTVKDGSKWKLPKKEMFFLTLLCLKQGTPVVELARIFSIAENTASCIFTTWVTFLNLELRDLSPIPPVKRVTATMQPQYPNFPANTLIMDCSEIQIQQPANLSSKNGAFSNCGLYNTLKFLIAATPDGNVVYVSPLYERNAPVEHIIRDSGFLQLLKPGHSLLADKGLEIGVLPQGVAVHAPPKVNTHNPRLPADVAKIGQIDASRVCMGRVIHHMKTFSILNGVLPVNMKDIAEEIVGTCAYLTNFKPPHV